MQIDPLPFFAAFVLVASAGHAIGGVELDVSSATPTSTITADEIESLPVSRDLQSFVNLSPNAAGVTRFAAEPGSYAIDLGGSAGRQKFSIRGDVLSTYRYVPGQGLVEQPSALPSTYPPREATIANDYAFDYRLENHALTLQFGTKYGTLYATGPEVLQRGAASTWTSALFPAGDSPRERARNTDALTHHELRIGGVIVPPNDQAKIVLREAPVIQLRYHDRLVASGTVPVLFGGPDSAGAVLNIPSRTPVVFAGGPITLPGTFDGDASTTRLTFNGNPLRVAAESPYGVSVYTPDDFWGLGEIHVQEGGHSWTVPVRSLGLKIWADDTDIWKGDRSTCHVKVTGLSGLDGSIQLQLINRTPFIIKLQQGNQPLIQLDPNRLTRPDELQIDREFVGIQRGNFRIQAILLPRSP